MALDRSSDFCLKASCIGTFWKMVTPPGDIFTYRFVKAIFVDGHLVTIFAI